MGKSPNSITGWRKLAIALLALLWLPFVFAQEPNPEVSSPDSSKEAFIGTNVTIPLEFTNPGDDTGYGPYVDIIMPTGDGIELELVKYGPLNLKVSEYTNEDNGEDHPHHSGEILDLDPGQTLYVFELPY